MVMVDRPLKDGSLKACERGPRPSADVGLGLDLLTKTRVEHRERVSITNIALS